MQSKAILKVVHCLIMSTVFSAKNAAGKKENDELHPINSLSNLRLHLACISDDEASRISVNVNLPHFKIKNIRCDVENFLTALRIIVA